MNRSKSFATVACLFLACGAVPAHPAADTSAPTNQTSLKLTTVVAALPPGMTWLSMSYGNSCSHEDVVKNASGGHDPQDLPPYTRPSGS
jgi:hypothetical protein